MSCPPLKDWPEGATHFDVHYRNFLKKAYAPVLIWIIGKGWVGDSDRQYTSIPDDAYPRPSRESWTGEGLPSTDMEVEIRHLHERTHVGWIKARTLYIGTHTCVWLPLDGKGIEAGADLESVEFRPLRTAEQIAAEEREKAIEPLAAIISSFCDLGPAISSGLAGVIYDADYRKQEAQ